MTYPGMTWKLGEAREEAKRANAAMAREQRHFLIADRLLRVNYTNVQSRHCRVRIKFFKETADAR